jgi:serine/threonine-protein kinase
VPTTQERLTHAVADRYRIEAEIGRGGMAMVYRAHDLRHDRPVALKVLREDLTAEESGRFLREIRVVARLTHPHILPLHDSGEKKGLLYYVMPLVGETLRQRLTTETRLAVDDAVRIAVAVAEALSYAHARDVLHRDIKPENILFNAGYPLVADFGVARAISLARDAVTERGVAVGTPAYMSPEQASGDDDLDGRSDVYSLACVLYEMLAGEPPFAGGSARKVMLLHMTTDAPPVRTKRPDVPAGLAIALDRALAKTPDDRFTADAFATALRGALSGSHPAPVVRGRRMVAVLPFVNPGGDPQNEYLSDGLTDELINALARVEGLEVASRTSVFALKGRPMDVRAIGAHLNVPIVLEGTVRRAGPRLRITAQLTDVADGRLMWSERYDRELEDVFDVQDEIARAIVTTLRRTVLRDLGEVHPRRYTESVAAYNLYLKGRWHWNRRTPGDVEQAITLFEQALAEDAACALAHAGLADAYALQLDYRSIPVQEGLERAKAEARRALELDEELSEPHTSLGFVTFIYEWDWEAAEREFRRAIELDPRYATAHQWYAWLLVSRGRVREALAEVQVAVELDPVSVSPRRSLGWISYHARDYDAAVFHLRRALTLDPMSEENHRLLGLMYMMAGDLDRAETELREALRLVPDSQTALGLLSHLLARAGRTDEAQAVLDDLLTRRERGYVTPVALGTAFLGLGCVDEALAEMQRAYDERRGWLTYMNEEPLFDAIRDDPRFAALQKKMRLG